MTVGGTALAYANWSADATGDDLETTNFESYVLATDTTYKERILGPIDATLSFGGAWDAGTNPLDDPPGLYPRDDLADVSFVTNQTDANSWDFPYVFVKTAKSGAEVGGLVNFSVDGMSNGPFSFPTGSN